MFISTGLQSGKKLIIYNKNEILELLNTLHNILKMFVPNGNIKEQMLQETYYSSILSGAKTTLFTVQRALDIPNVPCDKHTQMVLNTRRALNKIYNGEAITLNSLGRLYGILTDTNTNLEITDKVQRLNALIHESTPSGIERAIIVHFYVLYDQLFTGVNGRMARLLQNYVLINNGYPKTQFISISKTIEEHKKQYKDLLNQIAINATTSDRIDMTQFMKFMLNIIIKACLEDESQLTGTELVVYMQFRTGIAKTLTSRQVAEAANISIDKVRVALNSITDKGILIKLKNGNKNFYRLKTYS